MAVGGMTVRLEGRNHSAVFVERNAAILEELARVLDSLDDVQIGSLEINVCRERFSIEIRRRVKHEIVRRVEGRA